MTKINQNALDQPYFIHDDDLTGGKTVGEKIAELKRTIDELHQKLGDVPTAAAALGSIRTPKKAANGKLGGRPRRMTITAQHGQDGWYLFANGELPQEGFTYPTESEAYQAASSLYPSNSVWQGRRTAAGYSIKLG